MGGSGHGLGDSSRGGYNGVKHGDRNQIADPITTDIS